MQIQQKNIEIDQISTDLQRRGEELQQKNVVLQQNDETLQECIRRIQDLSVRKLCCKATASRLVGSRVWRVIYLFFWPLHL